MKRHTITVTESPVCIAHQLHLPYESKCNRLHGHNYRIVVRISADSLDANGMVCDFSEVKMIIKQYDHAVIGRVFEPDSAAETKMECSFGEHHFQEIEPSTAENFALHLSKEIGEKVVALNPSASVDWVRCYETESSEVICR